MARMWAPGGGGGGGGGGERAAERPDRLKRAVGAVSARFAGYEQHDSQELLRCLLDALHDDTNRVRSKLAYEELKDPPDAPDAAVSEAWWRYFRARSDSRVWSLFAGQLRCETQCAVCRHRSRAFDAVLDLSLAIRDGRDCSLAQCLAWFTAPERIAAGDWFCPRCRKHQAAEKRYSLFRLPPVLVLHLKRFSSGAAGSPGFGFGGFAGAHGRTKIAAAVSFPAEALDLAPFLAPESPDLTAAGPSRGASGGVGGAGGAGTLYDLCGVVNHMGGRAARARGARGACPRGRGCARSGLTHTPPFPFHPLFLSPPLARPWRAGSLNGGHYTADCVNRDDRQWRCYNDSSVRVSSGPRSLSPTSAYL